MGASQNDEPPAPICRKKPFVFLVPTILRCTVYKYTRVGWWGIGKHSFLFKLGLETNHCTNEDGTQKLNFGAAKSWNVRPFGRIPIPKYSSNPYTYTCNLSCIYVYLIICVHQEQSEGPTPQMPPVPGKKALLGDDQGTLVVQNPLNKALFLRGVALGGGPQRFPWKRSMSSHPSACAGWRPGQGDRPG